MRRIVYSVAMSLDGYIAGPQGEYDWIVSDPDIDFAELASRFDTLLMGRKTYQPLADQGGGPFADMSIVVASRTLRAGDHPAVAIVADLDAAFLDRLRAQPGKDIWLFGGGELFRSLLAWGQVDEIQVAIIPVLVGAGIPVLPPPGPRTSLELVRHRLYPKTGIVSMHYVVRAPTGPALDRQTRR